jgi:hypothetical protein
MTARWLLPMLAVVSFVPPTVTTAGARTGGPAPALRVFLDCNAPNCDFDHFRTEVGWVSWVRDRQDAQIHLLITAEQTGGGGWRYTLDYLGRLTFSGVEKSLTYVSDPNDTDTETRDAVARTIGLGLVEVVENTCVARRLSVTYDASEAGRAAADSSDPWDLWVFELGAFGSLDGEASQSRYAISGYAAADRVSDALKLSFDLGAHYNREEFDLDDGTIASTSEDYSARGLAVWSLTQHWSAGLRAAANRSTFVNRDLAIFGGPAIEYNIYPYLESTRRQLTFRYALEVAAFDYELETVESKTAEVLPRHVLRVGIEVQQPWGEIEGSVEAIQYLHDPATHRLNLDAYLEFRLFRGFDLEIYTELSRIKDQFFLPNEDLPEEEVLLRRRQRETGFQFELGIGFSYRFGSKFANIVNPRMGS